MTVDAYLYCVQNPFRAQSWIVPVMSCYAMSCHVKMGNAMHDISVGYLDDNIRLGPSPESGTLLGSLNQSRNVPGRLIRQSTWQLADRPHDPCHHSDRSFDLTAPIIDSTTSTTSTTPNSFLACILCTARLECRPQPSRFSQSGRTTNFVSVSPDTTRSSPRLTVRA